MKKIQKVAVANRGEVAVRIIQACHELGIKTVLLHSEPDTKSIAYRMSDECVCIGPASRAESYLSIEKNIQGALKAKADAIHPGFGFLSENADFSAACEKNGLVFIGPRAETISLLGDKVSAKKLMQAAKVPTVPGYQGDDVSVSKLTQEANKMGYPVLIKAAAGGGGRGMKVARSEKEMEEMISSAQREAKEAFGNDRVFLEKYIENPKHIEFQIFGDSHGNVVHLFERECSVQRRHQKIIEEAGSPSLTPALREKMSQAAVAAAQSAKYRGAGTVEFLLDGKDFYFLEINTRLQVEHTVSEMICGVDLVKTQILVAQGEKLPWKQSEITAQGHAIECRLYAEDAFRNGIPSTGEILFSLWPHGPGRRFDVGFEVGDEITPFYDPMIAKLIVYDETRERAIQKMLQVLKEIVLFGVKTNIPYLAAILNHPEFQNGKMTTRFLEKYFPEGITEPALSSAEKSAIEKLYREVGATPPATQGTTSSTQSPWLEDWKL